MNIKHKEKYILALSFSEATDLLTWLDVTWSEAGSEGPSAITEIIAGLTGLGLESDE